MTAMPILCGHSRNNHGCTQLATVAIDSHGRHTLACPTHRGAAERWAATNGTVTVTAVVQPADAVAGDGQVALFELDGAM